MTTEHDSAPVLKIRLGAVKRALRLLYKLSKHKSTFTQYAGHLLLAFYFIGSTTADPAISRQALSMGRERARQWNKHHRRSRQALDKRTVLPEVFASYAAHQLGLRQDRYRQQLQSVIDEFTFRELLGFDPSPGTARLRHEEWYCALIATYFCERHGIRLGASHLDVLRLLPGLRPYPRPGSRNYRDCIYAITHVVYTLNDYNRVPLSPRWLPLELQFLEASMKWALDKGEADTIGEIIDSLAAFGLADTHPLMLKGRTFLVEHQRRDGGWGDEHDEYGRFHTVWTGIDGLRDYKWDRSGRGKARIRRALSGLK